MSDRISRARAAVLEVFKRYGGASVTAANSQCPARLADALDEHHNAVVEATIGTLKSDNDKITLQLMKLEGFEATAKSLGFEGITEAFGYLRGVLASDGPQTEADAPVPVLGKDSLTPVTTTPVEAVVPAAPVEEKPAKSGKRK